MRPKPGSQCRWSTHGRVVISPIPGSYRVLSFRTLYGLLSEHSAESLGPRTLCTVDVGLHSAHRAQPLRRPLGHCSLQRGDRPTVHLLRPTTWRTIYASSKVCPHVTQRPLDHSTPTTRPTADELYQHSAEWNPGHKLMVLAMCRNRTHNLSDGAQPPLKATQ
ncbi:hypothetical protein BDZ97DRAFT_1856055 [Flammula alnicola]|nr:hypothetical protein BDZ97DRAFT_1856055 [Flammula alnicola]